MIINFDWVNAEPEPFWETTGIVNFDWADGLPCVNTTTAQTVTMYMRNNQFTVIAGATAGTSVMRNNKITITVGGVSYTFNPLSRIPNVSGYVFYYYSNVYTFRITN